MFCVLFKDFSCILHVFCMCFGVFKYFVLFPVSSMYGFKYYSTIFACSCNFVEYFGATHSFSSEKEVLLCYFHSFFSLQGTFFVICIVFSLQRKFFVIFIVFSLQR